MYNSNFSLTDFVYSVPVCQLETKISSLLTIFLGTKHHYIAIVDRNDHLVGLVSDRSLYARIIESNLRQQQPESQDDLVKNSGLNNNDSELLVESPIILSAQMSLSESLAYFKLPPPNNESNPIYALLDAKEKFLGILDTEKLIKFLLLDRQDILESNYQLTIESWQKWSSEILNYVPLPLSLQTQEGKTIYENICWQEKIGKTKDLTITEKDLTITETKKESDLISNDRTPEFLRNEPSCLSDRVFWQSKFFIGKQRSLENPKLVNTEEDSNDRIFVESDRKAPILVENFYLSNNYIDSYQASLKNELVQTANSRNSWQYWQAAKACLENSVNWQRLHSMQASLHGISVGDSRAVRLVPPKEGVPTRSKIDRNPKEDWKTIRLPIQEIPVSKVGKITEDREKADFNSIFNDRLSTSNFPCWLVLATKNNSQQPDLELVNKNTELVAINRLKDELIATLSHELKSPLTAILGLSSLLKEQKLGELNQRQNRYMELIHNSARQLMSIVNNLLDLARLQAGQLQLSPEPLNIKTACEKAYQKTVETLLKKKQQSECDPRPKFTLTIEAGLEIVSADELRLQQMLVNLLDNAHKFTATDGEIGLVVERWTNYVAFTVWDSGIGIPEEVQSSILSRFSRVEDDGANSVNGKGLGLILTQKLALAHGGDISFISKVDRGSEFTLLLPIYGDRDRENMTSERSTDKSENNPGLTIPKELILVVEEVGCDLENSIFNFKGLGYHVIVARTEIEALEKARQLKPDKILLNLNSSSFSGWDVLTLLKNDPALKDIPTIAIGSELVRQKAKSNGADEFLSLPIQREAFTAIFLPSSREHCSDRQSLRILRLYPEADAIKSLEDADNNQFEFIFKNYLSSSHHRIIEADSLEQADLLTRIWKLDVVVIDGSILKDPLEYLRSLKEHHALASLPLVILDAKTTKIANQIRNLSVFPCLICDREQNSAKVLEVIEIAAKTKNF